MSAEQRNDAQAEELVPLVPVSASFQNGQGMESQQDESANDRPGGPLESKPVFPDERNKLPKLDFKPLTLRFWFLCLVLTWNLVVTGILTVMFLRPTFPLTNMWTYFVVQLLPLLVGTVTAAFLNSTVLDLARVTPFILCAAGDSTTSAYRQGSIAGDSILGLYFPNFSYTHALASRNGLLLVSNILEFIVVFILAFKASLLRTFLDKSGNVRALVNEWAALFLLVTYVMIDIHTVWIMCYMWKRTTGLRWNPSSIADCLVLFRNASFLDEFAGTCIASSSSTRAKLRNLRLRLGYWKTGTRLWHGFDAITPSHHRFSPMENEAPLELSMEQLSRRRYTTTGLFMRPTWRITFAACAALLVAAHTFGLIRSDEEGKLETGDLSCNVVVVVSQFVPVILISLFNGFWEDIAQYMAHTQPFVALQDDATADQSLLLDYACLPRPVAIFTALAKGHTKLGITSAVAILQRLLPILAGASVKIGKPKTTCTVHVSFISFYVIIIWLCIYALWISWDLVAEGYERHLPHSYDSIADLLSWTYASGLLRDDNLCVDKEGTLAGNPLDVKITDPIEAETEANKSRRAMMQDQGEEWYMKSRLKLAGKRYRFGLAPVHGNADLHTVGIGVVDEGLEVIDVPAPRRLRAPGFLRRRWGAAGGEAEPGKYKIAGAGWASEPNA